jgi:catechol 2,3-dioxygenase-like lactoylglutathione lyase family enzyme
MTSISLIQINHLAVHVAELSRSVHFYAGVLGLQQIEEPFKDGLHAWFSIGVGASLHLIEAEECPREKSKVNHLCFSVSDFEGFLARLSAIRHPYGNWQGEEGAITYRGDGIRQIFFQDPDGYWLEINDDF